MLEDARVEVERQRRQWEQLFLRVPAAISILSGPDWEYTFVNPSYQALFPGRQLVGQRLVAALPAATSEPLRPLLQHVYTTGETYAAREQPLPVVRTAEEPAEERYFDLTYQARYDEQGQIDGLVTYAYEVTGQVLARQQADTLQAALLAAAERRSQERQNLYVIFEQAPTAVVLLREPDHRLEYYNPAFEQLFPGQNRRGQPFAEAYAHLHLQALVRRLDHVYATGETYMGQEETLPGLAAATQMRYFNCTYQAYREQEQIAGVAVFLYEVTEQVQSQQQVQHLNEELAVLNEELTSTNEELGVTNDEFLDINTRLQHVNADLDTFVYTASHDLKAPITNIEVLVQVLREETATGQWNETAEHVLQLIQESVGRFRTTLGHLTEVARMQPETKATAAIELAPLIQAVQQDLHGLLHATQARVIVDTGDCPQLRVPAKTVRAVVYNLLSNVVKYRAPERRPEVLIRCRTQSGQVVLEVRDNGVGLDLDKQTELFELFRRYHPQVEGAGVGLFMVKRMVEHAGGHIQVRSQLGYGSTFTVWLPA